MARVTGTFPFSANFEVKLKGMLDARMFAPTYADLLLFTNSNYLMNGFIVAVWDADPVKRGIYQLVDENNLNLEASWKNISSSSDIPDNLQTIIDDFEQRIADLEAEVIQIQLDIIDASTLANQALTEILNTQADLDIQKDRIDDIEDTLPLKADLVGGKVPVTQLTVFGATKLYDDIADRDADTDLTGVVLGLVLDASDDPEVGTATSALYANTTSGWVLYDASPNTEIILEWANIIGKPVSTPTQIDQAVEDSLNQADITFDITVGAWNANETLPALSNWEQAIRKLGEKIFYPTYQNPSFSLSNNAGSLREVGESANLNLTFNFNRGNILGNVVGGVWNPSSSQNPRAGASTSYTINGTTQSGNVLNIPTYAVLQGSNTFAGTVSYATGSQPVDSKGNNYQTPLASGTSASQNTSFEGVYPLFGTTSNITTATKQGLVSMVSGNNIQINLVAETGGNKQFFEIADAWVSIRPITAINYFNTVSNQFDTTNKLSDFTITTVSKTIQGNTVSYKRYTYNGSDRAGILIRLIF